MSKLSETVTSTPEEKWGLMADAEAPATTSATKVEKPKVEKAMAEEPKAETTKAKAKGREA